MDDLSWNTSSTSSNTSTKVSPSTLDSLDDTPPNSPVRTSNYVIHSTKIVADLKAFVPVSTIVDNFLRQYAERTDEINVVLTNVIFNVCRPSSFAPIYLEVVDIRNVKILIEQMENAENEKQKYEDVHPEFNNLVEFLVQVASSRWKNLSNEGQFDSYFAELMTFLSESNELNLRRLSVYVRLALIDTITNDLNNITDLLLEVVKKYATDVLVTTFRDSSREIWVTCLNRLGEWLIRGSPFLEDKYLRFVIFSLKEKSVKVVRHALEISITLMNRESCRPYLKSFAKLLALSLVFVQSTDFKDYKLICKCCASLYRYSEWLNHSLSINFNELIWDRVFDFRKRDMAKNVAKIFRKVVLRHESQTQNVLEMVRFLSDKNFLHVRLFVEASIENCNLITDWQLLASVLKQGISTLKEAEKEVLLTIAVATVEHIVTERSRPENSSPSDENLSQELANAFGPVVETEIYPAKLLKLRQILCIQLAKYFSFNTVPVGALKHVISSCNFMLMNADLDFVQLKVLVGLLVEMSEKCTLPEIPNLCKNSLEEFKTYIELHCDRNFGESGEQAVAQCSPEKALMGVSVLSEILPLPERYCYILPLEILTTDVDELAIFREISVTVAVNYAKFIMKLHKSKLTDEEENQKLISDQNKLENVCQEFQNICNMIVIFFSVLRDEFQGRLGQVVFLAICECIIELSKVDEALVPIFFIDSFVALMALYITAILHIPTSENDLPKVIITNSEKTDIVQQYFKLIISGILPLSFAYDVIISYCKGTSVLELPLKSFLLTMCEKTSAEEMAKCLLTPFIDQATDADPGQGFADVVAEAKELSLLLHSFKKEVRGVIRCIHFVGIDFSTGAVQENRISFLYLLAEFSCCLDKADKADVLRHLGQKTVVDPHITQHYIKSISKINVPESVKTTDEQHVAVEGNAADIDGSRNTEPEKRHESRIFDTDVEMEDIGAAENIDRNVENENVDSIRIEELEIK